MVSALPSSPCLAWSCRPKSGILEKGNSAPFLRNSHHICLKPQVAPASTFGLPTSPDLRRRRNSWAPLAPKASVGGAEYAVEPETSVKFEKDLTVPGCASSMVLLGTGYREKVFAIIGVKVYAAGFYADPSLKEKLSSWKGLPASELLDDASLFESLLKASAIVKSLKIVLVRDVDGITFWNALNDVISPRIKEPTAVDESALTTFRTTFESRPLTKGTVILLTLAEPSKMLVSISSQGSPSAIDAVIESINVNLAFFDAFFCNSPVSPTLKKSVSNGVEVLLNRP